MVNVILELTIFLSVWTFEVIWRCREESLHYFIWKFSTLTWITVNLTIIYFIAIIIGVNRKLRSFFFLASYALTMIVVLAYWLLYSIKPSLVDRFEYTAYDLDYFINIFIHGGNLLILTWHARKINEFEEFSINTLLYGDTIFIVIYLLIQKLSKQVTGISVYDFLDELTYTQLTMFNGSLYVIALCTKAFILRILKKSIKLN